VERYYGSNPPHAQRDLPPDCDVQVTGDYVSAWIWKWSKKIIGDGIKFRRYRIGIREAVIAGRLLFWLYLVITTEQIIAANNLMDENTWTYGQIFPLILLIIPISELWKYCYREFGWFRHHFDSYLGHAELLYSLGTLVAGIQTFTIFYLAGWSLFSYMLWLFTLVCFVVMQYAWSSCSISFDKLFGNEVYIPASSYWRVIFSYHEIKLPSQTAELEYLLPPPRPLAADARQPEVEPLPQVQPPSIITNGDRGAPTESPVEEHFMEDVDITELSTPMDQESFGSGVHQEDTNARRRKTNAAAVRRIQTT
jgi:hypothetical protein